MISHYMTSVAGLIASQIRRIKAWTKYIGDGASLPNVLALPGNDVMHTPFTACLKIYRVRPQAHARFDMLRTPTRRICLVILRS